MVDDKNNFDDVREAFDASLAAGTKTVYRDTLNQIRTNMAQGKDALGNRWAPLAESTVAAKGHSTPLIETGNLVADLETSSEFNQRTATGIIGTSTQYGPIHEFGAPEAGIPARPFLGPGARYARDKLPSEIAGDLNIRLKSAEVD